MSYHGMHGLGGLGALIPGGPQVIQLRAALAAAGWPSPGQGGQVDVALANALRGMAPRFEMSAKKDVEWYTKKKKGQCGAPPCLRVSQRYVTALLQGQAANVSPVVPPGGPQALPGERLLAPTVPEGGGVPGPMVEEEPSSFPWGLVIVGGVVVVGGVGALIWMKKRKAKLATNRRRRRR